MATAHKYAEPELPVDATLRKIVLVFRLLGWGWMMLLVALTPSADPEASLPVVIGAAVLATAWTGLTLWAAADTRRLRATSFVAGDIATALLVGSASTIAGAENLFHGGYPISALAVVAYGFGLRGAVAASFLLAGEQFILHEIDGKGLLPAVGSVTFIVFAILMGWAFDQIREQQRIVLATQKRLGESRDAQARHEERLELANRLHDTVLQTLIVLRRHADDPQEVHYLARRQERQLRRTISEYRSPYANSARAALQGVCDDIEDVYRIEIDVLIRGDANTDECCEAILAATQEALVNAAKHSGVQKIDLYAELRSDRTKIFVRDRGTGFDPQKSATGRGIDHGLLSRVQAVGGTVTISTSPDGGTEVAMSWEAA
jgi:signal transduction histidine kinase